ncbi:synphilin-1 isoform X2 [Perognathus longimembris pacificus]|uniref:synphilin-1 isoform X2 n=1 Tax=Perognathus longimembris pacificus TaxID=214514 RepID=UPI002018492A|nr:synphilin-1 isoform X2 [Perognathus longimembris pacificus]
MEAPEYLDLDEIDFSDDISYSVTSLKTIPELCRRCDSQTEDRPVSSSGWNCGVSTLTANTQKPTGIADVYSKFRPVKRVSPLKHQPETLESNENEDGENQEADCRKGGEPGRPERLGAEDGVRGVAGKGGEPEHYDLDMDEILDVPYIKSAPPLAAFAKAASEKRVLGLCAAINGLAGKACAAGSGESSPPSATPCCVLSPVKSPLSRRAPAGLRDRRQPSAGDAAGSPPLRSCGSGCEPESQSRDFSHGPSSDPQGRKTEKTAPECQLRSFHPPPSTAEPRPEERLHGLAWPGPQGPEERTEHLKKVKSILNIVKEGQISLLNGQLECVRWMVSETEAIAELSCSKDFPSLIHYAGCHGQEKILLWLLQFMQEQGISLDEVDQEGNSAVHAASRHGHLGCIQTLVEYGANVTAQNRAGEKPSQSAERRGHTLCARYLVVVETCMSLASQVVKLTKQLKEQTVERVTLQKQLQQLLEAQKPEGRSLPSSPSSPLSPASRKPQWKASDAEDEAAARSRPALLEGPQVLGSPAGAASRARAKAKDDDPDKVLRQLLGKEMSEQVCAREKLTLEFQDAQAPSGSAKKTPPEKRELKLARLRQLMQRSLSESDTDSSHSEDPRAAPARKAESAEPGDGAEGPPLAAKKHAPASSGRRFPFGAKAPRPAHGHSPSPTSEGSEPDGEPPQPGPDSPAAPKAATSPKSALKSPSSKRRTSQNSKLRVTFEEPLVQGEQPDPEPGGDRDREKGRTVPPRAPAGSEPGEPPRRPFGTFRSIMETLSGNQNNNNNCPAAHQLKTSTLPSTSLGRKTPDKGNPAGPASSAKNKAEMSSSCFNLSSNTLVEEYLRNSARHNDTCRKMKKSNSIKHIAEPESKELFL